MDCQAITKLLSQRTPRCTHLRRVRCRRPVVAPRGATWLAARRRDRCIAAAYPGDGRVAHHASTWGWESTVAAERHGPLESSGLSGILGGRAGLVARGNTGPGEEEMEERLVAVWSGKKGREPRGMVLRGYQRIPATSFLGPDGPKSAPSRSRSRCKRPAILNSCDMTCRTGHFRSQSPGFTMIPAASIWLLVRSTEPCALRAWTVTDFAICGYSVSVCRAGGMVLHGAAGARISIGGDQGGGGVESEKARAVRQHRHRSRWTYSRTALHAQFGLGCLSGRQDAGLPVLG
jgi:hypothetical protein